MSTVKRFATVDRHGFAVQFSPFHGGRVLCGASANYGIAGGGRLYVLTVPSRPSAPVAVERVFDTDHGVFDACWSEAHEQHILAACADGSVRLFDLSEKCADNPRAVWREHVREVMGVHWNPVEKRSFLSASWDGTVRMWHPSAGKSLHVWQEHSGCVYGAVWSPHYAEQFASVSADGSLRIFDVRATRSTHIIAAHDGEALCVDWNKYAPTLLCTGGSDRCVKIWDLRFSGRELATCIVGHEFGVRRVKCSPYHQHILASAGYDMTLRFWDTRQCLAGRGPGVDPSAIDGVQHQPTSPTSPQVVLYGEHQEFVLGFDWNLHVESSWATCSWDESVHVMM